MEMSGQLHAPAALSAAKEPTLHVEIDAFDIVTNLLHA
jgi:hypothetical protein